MRNKKYKRFIYLFIINIFSLYLFGQDSLKIKFYEIINEDSVVMYFNDSYNFTEKNCFKYQRFTRIDQYGDFFQSVIDKDTSNRLLGKGWYVGGYKNGQFETFYTNGQVRSVGNYEFGRPIGDWYYYYSDGKLERHLKLSLTDTLLIEFFDKNNIQLVKDGSGYFNGSVWGFDIFYRNETTANGKIVKGKPDGEWKSERYNYPFCTEVFDNGKFIKGNFPSARINQDKFYTEDSYLNTLFLPSYFNRLEEYRLSECPKQYNNLNIAKRKTNSNINLENFRSFIVDAINRVIEDDTRNGKYLDYLFGENHLKISFIVDNEGTPRDFKQLTSWGDQYYYAITNSLTMHAKLPTFTERMYFNLIVIKRDGNTISYNYYFTNE